MLKILILGIEGFVGGYLLEKALDMGFDVFGTYFNEATLNDTAKKKCKLRLVDIRKYEEVSCIVNDVQPDYIFHLAAQSSASISWKKPQLTMEINITGTINLLEAVKNYSMHSRILIIGSSEQYGIIKPENNPIDETHSIEPMNPYAISKATCENLCKLYIHAYNLNIVMVRSFNHVGVNQSTVFAISNFAKTIAKISIGQKYPIIEVGNLKAKRDFTDVRDVISAYIIIAEKGICGEVYNVGTGKTKSIKHYLDYMINRENLSVEIVQAQNRIRPSDNPSICCNNLKLKKLGWKCTYNIYETIDEMIDYWKAYCSH